MNSQAFFCETVRFFYFCHRATTFGNIDLVNATNAFLLLIKK